MELMQALNKRYSTKKFDPSKKISDENMEKIETLLQLAPSSTNVQPWKFILTTSDEGKKRIAKATQGPFSFNEHKVLNASAVAVFAAKTKIDEDHLLRVLDQEAQDGRYADPGIKEEYHTKRKSFVDLHQYDRKDLKHWTENQVFLNLGVLLLGVAQLGIDAVPMEGLDMDVLDQEFSLQDQGFSSAVVVALGYRDESDFNAKLAKSRLDKSEIIERV